MSQENTYYNRKYKDSLFRYVTGTQGGGYRYVIQRI